MGALAMQSPHRISILAIESQAIYRGVLFAAGAVMMINSGEIIWATVGNIMDDVRD
ncbi:hypothetical protein ACE6H2_015671 [Prunus campanulata]